MAEPGDNGRGKKVRDEWLEFGRDEGLDVVWGHEEAGVHVFMVLGRGG